MKGYTMIKLLTLLVLQCFLGIAASITMEWCVNHAITLFPGHNNCAHFTDQNHEYEDLIKLNNITCTRTNILQWDPKLHVQNYDIIITYITTNQSYKFWYFLEKKLSHESVAVVVIYSGENLYLPKLFTSFWYNRVSNIILIDSSLNLYTYYPISQGMCKNIKPVFIGHCKKVREFHKEADLPHFHNCTLIVQTIQNRPFTNFGSDDGKPGIEDNILIILAERLNFLTDVSCAGCNFDKFDFALVPPYDLAMAGLSLGIYIYLSEDILNYAVSSELAIFTHFARPIAPWKKTFYIFDPAIWMSTLITVVALALVAHFARIKDALIFVVSTLFLNTCKTTTRIKLLFLAWNVVALILTSVYSGLLLSFMCRPKLEKQLNSLDDLFKAGYHFGGSFIDVGMIDGLTDHPSFEQRGEGCKMEASECYERLVKGNFGYLCSTNKMMYRLSLNKTHNWYKMPSMYNTYMMFLAPKSSHFGKRVRWYLDLMGESGIIDKLNVYKWKHRKNKNNSGLEVVTLEHLYFAFIAYVIGIVLSVIAYAFEKLI